MYDDTENPWGDMPWYKALALSLLILAVAIAFLWVIA